jgi:hypothetical protein
MPGAAPIPEGERVAGLNQSLVHRAPDDRSQ